MRGLKTLPMTLMVICATTLCLPAQYLVSGVLENTKKEIKWVQSDDWNTFQTNIQQLNKSGYHIEDFEMHGQSKQKTFFASCSKSDQPQRIIEATEWVTFVSLVKANAEEGWKLNDIEASAHNDGSAHFVGILTLSKKEQQLWKMKSLSSAFQLEKAMQQKQLFLKDIEVVKGLEGQYFLLSFEKGLTPERTHFVAHVQPDRFLQDRLQRQKSGYRLTDFEQFQEGQRQIWLGVFEKGTFNGKLHVQIPIQELEDQLSAYAAKGLHLGDFDVWSPDQLVLPTNAAVSANYLPSKE